MQEHAVLHALLESAPFAMILVDAALVVRRCSRRVFGEGDGSAYVGRAVRELPGLGPQLEACAQRQLARAGTGTCELQSAGDGEARYWTVSVFAAGDDGALAIVLHDVTVPRRLEASLRESERQFRLLADHAPVLIWLGGPLGCTFVNQTYVDFVGCSMDEILSSGWERFVHPADAARLATAFSQCVEHKEPFQALCRFQRADGAWRWLRSIGTPLLSEQGQLLGYVGCSVDVTDDQSAQEALQQADARKNTFLATLAHELRNPLAPILNSVAILRNSHAPGDAEWARDVIQRQVQHMARLLDDLLDVSRIAAGKLELRRERVALREVVERAVETSRPLVQEGQHELSIELPADPVHLDADPTRLAQVLANLLNNAAKYTDRGGHIRLAVARRDGELLVTVADDGIGMDRALLPHLFEVYCQAHQSLDRSQGGLGLGLSLARGLVEMHGGSIAADSPGLGGGSVFTIRLPLPRDADTPGDVRGPGRPARARRSRPLRVLVVDDDADTAESLARVLAQAGHEVVAVRDGEAALASAPRLKPDVVLLDLSLPRLDGLEIARRLRRTAHGAHAKLVALTGWGQDEDRRRCEEAGFDDHLVKPVDPDRLFGILGSLGEPGRAAHA